MSKSTYYIVQTLGDMWIMQTADGRYVPTFDMDKAARLSFSTAQSIYKTHCHYATADTPRRFPRIIKVSIETKTIKERR